TLWSVVGYFAQKASSVGGTHGSGAGGTGPRYNSSEYTISAAADPYNNFIDSTGASVYAPCAQSYVLLITDGLPTRDGNIPSTLTDYVRGKTDYNCQPYATISGLFVTGPALVLYSSLDVKYLPEVKYR
ncbi:hypothetical protein MBAV_004965, partial [Candidatus Magnetobacterium bavaricum]